jgi:hypothetical protein
MEGALLIIFFHRDISEIETHSCNYPQKKPGEKISMIR